MDCPKCSAEYVAGSSRCSDCDLPLVEARLILADLLENR